MSNWTYCFSLTYFIGSRSGSVFWTISSWVGWCVCVCVYRMLQVLSVSMKTGAVYYGPRVDQWACRDMLAGRLLCRRRQPATRLYLDAETERAFLPFWKKHTHTHTHIKAGVGKRSPEWHINRCKCWNFLSKQRTKSALESERDYTK